MEEFFGWSEDLAMNVEEIDTQHRYLIGLVNDYHKNQEETEREQIEDVLSFLINYAQIHFSLEEKMMASHNYPDREAHITEHVILARVVAEMVAENDNSSKTRHKTMAVFLKNWLTDHIQQTDRKLAQWLNAAKV